MKYFGATIQVFFWIESLISVGIQSSLSRPIGNIGLYIAKALLKPPGLKPDRFLKPRRFGGWIVLEFDHQQSGPLKKLAFILQRPYKNSPF
jgi:hypothetical protein